MRSMTTPPVAPGAPDPADARPSQSGPGERRLDRPPSDRYRTAAADAPDPLAERPRSVARGLLFADLVALVGAGAIVVLGGVLAQSAGLIVVAALIGRAVAIALRLGAGPTLAPPRLTWIAVGLALVGVALGQVGLWLFAASEGGVLPLPTYLAETFGFLVPIQLGVAAVFAWWAAR